jgi:hypothetical protein
LFGAFFFELSTFFTGFSLSSASDSSPELDSDSDSSPSDSFEGFSATFPNEDEDEFEGEV